MSSTNVKTLLFHADEPSLLSSWILFVEVIPAKQSLTKDILVPWISFFAIATVVSIVGMMLKVRVFVRLLRERHDTLAELVEAETDSQTKFKSHRKKMLKTSRRIHLLYPKIRGFRPFIRKCALYLS